MQLQLFLRLQEWPEMAVGETPFACRSFATAFTERRSLRIWTTSQISQFPNCTWMKEGCWFSGSMCSARNSAIPRLAFDREEMSYKTLPTNMSVLKKFEKRPNPRFFRTNALDTVWRRTSPVVGCFVACCIWPTPQAYFDTCVTPSPRDMFYQHIQRFIPYQ